MPEGASEPGSAEASSWSRSESLCSTACRPPPPSRRPPSLPSLPAQAPSCLRTTLRRPTTWSGPTTASGRRLARARSGLSSKARPTPLRTAHRRTHDVARAPVVLTTLCARLHRHEPAELADRRHQIRMYLIISGWFRLVLTDMHRYSTLSMSAYRIRNKHRNRGKRRLLSCAMSVARIVSLPAVVSALLLASPTLA